MIGRLLIGAGVILMVYALLMGDANAGHICHFDHFRGVWVCI